jgi:hypothetical protein
MQSDYASSLTTYRVMALEILLETLYGLSTADASIYGPNSNVRNTKLDKLLKDTTWHLLVLWLFGRYKNASIIQGLIYKILYFVIRQQHYTAIEALFACDSPTDSNLLTFLHESLQGLHLCAVHLLRALTCKFDIVRIIQYWLRCSSVRCNKAFN